MDLCCTNGVFAEPGWSSSGQKRIPRLEADRSLGDERLALSSRLKVYPAWFLQSYLLSHKPRGCNDTGKVLFLDAQRQTTIKDNEVGRQRSQGCTACTVWVTLWWCTFCPSAFRLVNFTRNFFRGGVAISNEKKLSQFLLKKLVWFCEWAIIIMPGCSWNFFSEPFCGIQW